MKDNTVFLRHILDETTFIIRETHDLEYASFLKNDVLPRAVVRSLEIIGEATKNLSQSFQANHPEVNWRELTGLRDKLIHHYFGVSWTRVWDVIKHTIPGLEQAVKKVLEETEDRSAGNKSSPQTPTHHE